MYATDGRTDGRTKATLIVPSLRLGANVEARSQNGRELNNIAEKIEGLLTFLRGWSKFDSYSLRH